MLIVTTGGWRRCYCRCWIFTCYIKIETKREREREKFESEWIHEMRKISIGYRVNACVRFNFSSLGKLILTRSDKLILFFGWSVFDVRLSHARTFAPVQGNARNCTGILWLSMLLLLFAYNSDVCPIKSDARPHKRRDKYLRSISN